MLKLTDMLSMAREAIDLLREIRDLLKQRQES
jgi:hypothetical protein